MAMGFCGCSVVSTLLLIVAIFVGLQVRPRVDIPAHLLGHPAFYDPDIAPPAVRNALMDTMRNFPSLPSLSRDLRFYKATHEDVGEGLPIGPGGSCKNVHPLLMANANRTKCILPGRVDVARHFVKTGGVDGLKEPVEMLIPRLQAYGAFLFNYSAYDSIANLFSRPSFQKAATAVCPSGRPVLDPFQFNFIVQVPGQTVAAHVDGVYFDKVSRFDVPQWLLAVMQFSGLFRDHLVPQVQLVVYLHNWTTTGAAPASSSAPSAAAYRQGQFVYWDTVGQQDPHRVLPDGGGGSAVDGSQVVHAAAVYRADVQPPRLDPSADFGLLYRPSAAHPDKPWVVVLTRGVEGTSDTEEVEVRRYAEDDLRVTAVYRGRCFASEDERGAFHAATRDPDSRMVLESIFSTLRDDLVQRKVVSRRRWDAQTRLDQSLLLLDSYVKYPLPPNAWVPYNYCALPAIMSPTWKSVVQTVLSPFCGLPKGLEV
eukprot:TRINITY_DN34500_c0_g1_i1.p1 TRINITY_DN34500_c0_g1~~TRINITY_DN34500_c0_g1_i1.p1  ORF type:complete len:481 (-),score=85.64 TRINITY_DN34500_c0_g1_i1:531-1973(-)